jgi:lipopolysaccharide transport system ATP-binding protein
MNLHEGSAIVFQDVTKIYKLYQNQWQMVKDALGFKSKQKLQEFYALKNLNLTIKRGERIGLIGRNGAGKSTLLKLITGNFSQTTGKIIVNGSVQALMNTGVGFHPEFTGLENIRASLLYNGLEKKQFDEAVEDVIDFTELGDFLEQPLKTYSLGMQSRLYFAVATAIQPEILIVDEVLGAGDAYFSAKSADRMKNLTSSGCTLILVSHSTQQVLQFCDKAIWIESGEIVEQGSAIDVVKNYEQYSKKLELEFSSKNTTTNLNKNSIIQSKWLREKLLKEVLSQHETKNMPNVNDQFTNCNDGVSQWPSQEGGLKIDHISLLSQHGEAINRVKSGESLQIDMTIKAEKAGRYDVYFVMLLFFEDGRWLGRHCSEKFQLDLNLDEKHTVSMQYDEVLLGSGKYIFSTAIYKILDLNNLSTARYYDLLSRSFEFHVEGLYQDDTTLFRHPVNWLTKNTSKLERDELETKEKIEA